VGLSFSLSECYSGSRKDRQRADERFAVLV